MATEDPKRTHFSLPEIEVNPDGWGPSRVGYSWVTTQIKPSYTKQARKLGSHFLPRINSYELGITRTARTARTNSD